MPLNIPDNLPAIDTLRNENIFVMQETHAIHQDIRPLKIVILNLMPLKLTTETHLLRMLSNTPLQVEIVLMHTKTHISKHTPREHLETFYKTFREIEHDKYDGLIITGAPIEHLDFQEVNYWEELKEIMDWSVHHVTSTMFICWGAQAGLYHFYNIPKYQLPSKMFGVFEHDLKNKHIPIIRGFDDKFLAPHSRYTEIRRNDILKVPELDIVAESKEAGIYLVISKDGRQIFVTGHSEYDPNTLKLEYERDLKKGLKIDMPKNYFPDDNPLEKPLMFWRSHGNLLFSNWLNFYVYQVTPFDINEIK